MNNDYLQKKVDNLSEEKKRENEQRVKLERDNLKLQEEIIVVTNKFEQISKENDLKKLKNVQ